MKKRKRKHHLQPKLQDQALWMSLAAVFLLFFIGFISFSDRTILTGSAVQNIAYVRAGTTLINGVQEIPGLQQYSFEVLDTIKNGQMVVQIDNNLPFAGPFYSKFTISSDQPEKIGTISLSLKIPQQELNEKRISQGDLRVFHEGEEMPTTFLRQEGRYLYYTAAAPGVGNFVIGKVAAGAPPELIDTATVEEVAEEPLGEAPSEITTAIPEEAPAPLAPLTAQAAARPPYGFWAKMKSFFSDLFG